MKVILWIVFIVAIIWQLLSIIDPPTKRQIDNANRGMSLGAAVIIGLICWGIYAIISNNKKDNNNLH